MQKGLKKNTMSKSSKIIIGGCSFTDPKVPENGAMWQTWRQKEYKKKGYIQTGWKMWGELLAEHHGCEPLNTANCGDGNSRIFQKVTEELIENDPEEIKFVVVGWTEFQRDSYIHCGMWRNYAGFEWDERWKSHINPDSMPLLLEEQLTMMWSLQQTCKSLNVPLYQFQMLRPLSWRYLGGETHPMFQKFCLALAQTKIELKNFYNWPPMDIFGGSCMHDEIVQEMRADGLEDKDIYFAKDDHHLRKEGQERMAKKVIESVVV